jgi:hypothetical protein
MMEGEKMESHQKEFFFEVVVFFSSQNIDFPCYFGGILIFLVIS